MGAMSDLQIKLDNGDPLTSEERLIVIRSLAIGNRPMLEPEPEEKQEYKVLRPSSTENIQLSGTIGEK